MDHRVSTIGLVVIAELLLCAIVFATKEDYVAVQNEKSRFTSKKWISQLFQDAETAFTIDSNASNDCQRDFNLYLQHLSNQSIWAVRMMESSEWPSVGIFSGMVVHLGNYDECLTVSTYKIKGQYCLAQVRYNYQNDLSIDEFEEVPNEALSVWDAITMYKKNPVRIDRQKLNFALCIPSSCSAADLQISLNSTLYPLFRNNGFNVSVETDPIFCKTRSDNRYSREHYLVRWIFIVLLFVVISSTCYDIATRTTHDDLKKKKSENNSTVLDMCTYFSVVNNFCKLKKVTPNSDIAGLHLVKIVNIVFLVYAHRLFYSLGYPKFNPEGIERWYKPINLEIIHAVVVDVFFMVSGFIKFHFDLKPTMNRGASYLFVSILLRWIRMVPVFCVLMLYIIYIMPYTSEGPLWDYRIMNEVGRCQQSWWANFLAINNIVKNDQQCLVISWYISVDIQLTIIGGILLWIYAKNKTAGIIATVVTFVGSIVVTFIVAYSNQYHGLVRTFMSYFEEPNKIKEFTDFYNATHTRIGPYLIGFMAGLIVKILQEKKFKFSWKQMVSLSFLSILISEASQHYGFLFYQFNRKYSPLENAAFAATHRWLFVLTYAVHTCMYMTSGFGIFNKFFECNIYVPFGRLTYAVFLVNTVIQLYHASSQKQIMPTSGRMNLLWLAFADIIWCYVLGLVLHLFVEAPITNFSKSLKLRLLNESTKPKTYQDDEKNKSNIETNEKKKFSISID